jgi:7-carboxy-7-deazaguanine synthase
MQLKLTDLFYSVQGEGPAASRPAIFVRFSGCQLKCTGCDEKLKYGNKFEETSSESVISRVKNYLKRYPNSRIIFTGGEPLLQADVITEIIAGLPGLQYDIETNGITQDKIDLFSKLNLIVVSPKKDQFKSSKEVVDFFKKWTKISDEGRHNVFFKLVVGGLPWAWLEAEVKNIIDSGISPTKIWLMPAGDNPDKLNISGKNTWKVAARLNCNYSDRLHIRTGGK